MPIQAMEHDFFSTEFDKENELFSELKNMLSPQDFVFSSELASNEPILNVDPNDNDGKALKPLAPAKKKKSFKKKFRLSDKKIKKREKTVNTLQHILMIVRQESELRDAFIRNLKVNFYAC